MQLRFARFVLFFGVLAGTSFVVESGFRVYEFSQRFFHRLPPKQTGELRVFVYGESIAWGAPLPAVGFVEQLRHALTAIYPERYVNVVSYAKGGVTSSETAAIAADTMSQSPDVVIVMTGGNEYLPRAMLTSRQRRIRDASAAVRTITRWVGQARARWLSARDRWPDRLFGYSRADLSIRLDGFKANLAAMLDLAGAQGTPVLLATQPMNLRDWAPVHLKLVRADANGGASAYERAIGEIETLIANGRQKEAQAELDYAESIYDEDAMLLYLNGRLHYNMGQYGVARDLFTRAKELDPFPWRTLNAFSDVIRESGHRQGVRLVDVERIFSERSAGGSPGFDLLADNCHPNPSGSAIIAAAFVKEIRALVPLGANDRACCNAEDFMKVRNFKGSPLEVEYLLFSGKYTMKTPFYAFSLSRNYLSKAVSIAPSNWEAWANLATLSFLEKDVQRGREELNKARALKRGDIDPNDRLRTPYLREALLAAAVKQ